MNAINETSTSIKTARIGGEHTVDSGCGEMKTVLLLTGLVALALGVAVPQQHPKYKTGKKF